MKKLKMFSLISLGAICVSAGIVVFANADSFILRGRSTGDVYSATFTLNNFDTTTSYYYTNNKNKIFYKYNNIYISSHNKYFGKQSYFENTSMIYGLQSVTVAGLVGELKVEYGWNYCGYQNSATIDTSNNSFDFNGECPSYFKIRNESNTAVKYTSVSVTYSCSQTSMPSSYVNDLTFLLNDDNASYSVEADYGAHPSVVNIPSTHNGKPVTGIYDSGFYNEPNLERISIPDSVTKIGNNAFYKTTALKQIMIPDTVTSIGSSCFQKSGLEEIRVPDGVTFIPDYFCYQCESLRTVDLGRATSVNYSSFEQCSSLSSIIFPETLQNIGSFSFDSCTSLKHVSLPSSLISIGNSSFRRCSALEDFVVPENVQTIGHETFDSDTSLKTFKIGPSVTSIDMTCFCGDSALEKIFIPLNVTTLSQQVFYGCSKLTIYTEFSEAPSGWHSTWNSQGRPVVYNVQYSASNPGSGQNAYFLLNSYKWMYGELETKTYVGDIMTNTYNGFRYDSTSSDAYGYYQNTVYFDRGLDYDSINQFTKSCIICMSINTDDADLYVYLNGKEIEEDVYLQVIPGDIIRFEYSCSMAADDVEAEAEFEMYCF